MNDLNTVMRDQARAGLQTQLDAAVTAGDTEAARKISLDIEKLAVQTAPKAPPFNDTDIRAELDKQPWFGTDPKKSAKAVEFGKNLDPKKFSSAKAFADAVTAAVDAEFKPAATEPPENETDEQREAREAEEKAAAAKPRRTDGPGEGDNPPRNNSAGRRTGPWTKLTDAPAEVQKEITRQADKFAPKTNKEGREKFVTRALESHYAQHQRTAAAGKK